MRSLDRRRFSMLLAGALATPFVATNAKAAGGALGGPAFGSYWRLLPGGSADVDALTRSIAAIVAEVDAAMSPYRADSALGRFNRQRSADWQAIPPDCLSVLRAALDIFARSEGAFDPSVGPVVARYGFGPIRGNGAARLSDLVIGADGRIAKRDPGLTLDLCGIAKGHALDRIAAMLDAAGLGDYIVELGGEVRARGRHPQGRDWRIAIDAPGGGAQIVQLRDRAIATSGDRPQGYALAGRGYGHIIDPVLRAPAPESVAAASVLARNAAEADALATALCALPGPRALALAQRLGLDARLCLRGAPAPILTGNFAQAVLA